MNGHVILLFLKACEVCSKFLQYVFDLKWSVSFLVLFLKDIAIYSGTNLSPGQFSAQSDVLFSLFGSVCSIIG